MCTSSFYADTIERAAVGLCTHRAIFRGGQRRGYLRARHEEEALQQARREVVSLTSGGVIDTHVLALRGSHPTKHCIPSVQETLGRVFVFACCMCGLSRVNL